VSEWGEGALAETKSKRMRDYKKKLPKVVSEFDFLTHWLKEEEKGPKLTVYTVKDRKYWAAVVYRGKKVPPIIKRSDGVVLEDIPTLQESKSHAMTWLYRRFIGQNKRELIDVAGQMGAEKDRTGGESDTEPDN
jgi:hypothetical protein